MNIMLQRQGFTAIDEGGMRWRKKLGKGATSRKEVKALAKLGLELSRDQWLAYADYILIHLKEINTKEEVCPHY